MRVHIARSIAFIKQVAASSQRPLFAGNSGGKDSAVLDVLLQMSGVKYTSIHAVTTIDPIGTLQHIRENYPHTVISLPALSFFDLVEKKGLPTAMMRFCCEHLKEYVSVGRLMFEGVRASESPRRRGRDYIQCDTRKWQQGAQHVYPIYDWDDDMVFDFISYYKIKLAPAYFNGLSRLGCVMCPLVRKKGERQRQAEKYPQIFEAIQRAIGRGMKNNPQWKISCACENNASVAMDWWLSGATIQDFFPYEFEKTKSGWIKY